MNKFLSGVPRTLASGCLAGFMIGVGGVIFLKCDIAYIGALFFCVGLSAICTFGLCLFTGRVGYVLKNKNYADMAVIWVGNVIGAFLCGCMIASALPELAEKAALSAASRLSQGALKTFILSFFCGVLMYVAVDMYKALSPKGFAGYVGILLCIPTFILCGFEHSVADMFYFAAAGLLWQNLPHILLVSIGNAAGSIAICALRGYAEGGR